MSEEKKEEMVNVLNSLFSAFEKGSTDKAMAEPLFEFLKSKAEWTTNPDHLHLFVISEFDSIIALISKRMTGSDDRLVSDIWRHWNFFESHISNLCSRMYGGACSVDRGCHVTRSAIKWRLTGEVPDFSADDYWNPKSGSGDQWMEFVEGLQSLLYGRPEKYFLAYSELAKTHSVEG